ncbi:cob(I)yrinic acid a,c-diamide adenosyltransferase [Haloglycomyces albus]|uniref:cob(I)yrinic acid a,c-diamide adenosyltransferase n=1 Tax=Haloglycomyces albus TaxID=526067 RepID=UPI00046D1F89|nr:cob(I)yrinic acid a,c-diamide adenosyltransferase [Haloglycomyces albus]
MSVHLTKIYTKTGDKGTTALSDFSRVAKTSPRITAYADVDETNAAIGVALALGGADIEPFQAVLTEVQNDLFDVGADLSTPLSENPKYPPLRIDDGYVERLETAIDEWNEKLEPLRSFILRGGNPAAALLHQACTISRRAERSIWALLEVEEETTHGLPAQYLNRLSDLLFVLARCANGGNDVLWRPGESGSSSTDD